MPRIRIKHVDTFTRTPHEGNPAGVVDGRNVSEREMQLIARELNLSETAFILPSSKQNVHVRIRAFTPTQEVPFCGHAMLAAFHSLAEDGKMGMAMAGKFEYRVETALGILPVEVNKNDGQISVMMGLKLHSLEKAPQLRVELVRLLDVALSEFDAQFPVVKSDYLYVPVKRLHTLFNMQPDLLALSKFLKVRRLGGLCVFTTETVERSSAVHSRFFAPHEGINEDPVTGSSHGTLAACLYAGGMLKLDDGKCVFKAEQGDAIGRKGRLTVELDVDDEKPVAVRVGGTAVTILEAEMLLND